ncbi:MAG: HAMP domain-containing sensor histidine kinase [Lachnospiraceae bacterium]|nr:HAMP domain-containing sensor histidine kinase [Lachnospiraceae bacterium]
MIRNLKKRILITLTLILTLIFFLILLMLNIRNYRFNIEQNMNMLRQIDKPLRINDPDTSLPSNLPDSAENSTEDRGFGTLLDRLSVCTVILENGQYRMGELNQITDFTEDSLLNTAREVIQNGQEEGTLDNFLYITRTTPSQTTICLMDNSQAIDRIKNLALFSLILFVAGSVAIFGISLIISGWLVKPVDQAFTRQKQFISDASHELKTPLTVIGANAELLESEVGPNKWLSYIRSETQRMNRLVNELLSLARVENQSDSLVFSTFSLSNAVTSILLPFESIAFEQETDFFLDIEDDIFFHGDEEQLKQIVSILTDNALRHTKAEGTVRVKLSKYHKKIRLDVSNTGDPIPLEEQERIFDRFYRSDTSRERSSNRYGLGLAIARAIVVKHQGSLSVSCKDGWTTFHMELPYKTHSSVGI